MVNISHCTNELNFMPRRPWPSVLPAFCWNGRLICGFDRLSGQAVELDGQGSVLLDGLKAIYPELGLAEVARLAGHLRRVEPGWFSEFGELLFQHFGLRLSDRLEQTLAILSETPLEFQNLVDEKKLAPRDLAPLLSLPSRVAFEPFLLAMTSLQASRSELVRILELGIELHLLDHPMNDLLPPSNNGSLYLRRLEKWRRPQALGQDEALKDKVTEWPWPAHVQAEWQRFGDQAGLEVKIRTTSPEDFQKKLEKLLVIPESWQRGN